MKKVFTAVLSLCFVSLSLLPATAEEQPLLAAIQLKITGEFTKLDAVLQRTSRTLSDSGLTGGKARLALADLCKTAPYAINCAAVDANGKMVTMEPSAYKRFEGTDISGQDQIKSIQTTQKPVLSAFFRAVEGFDAIDLEYPVLTPEGKYLGSVSLLFKPDSLFKQVVRPMTQGEAAHIWVMERKGRIIYDDDPSQIGLNLFQAPIYKPYPQLLELGQRIAAEQEGHGRYQYKTLGGNEIVKKAATWKTVSLYGTEWRIVGAHLERGESERKQEDSLRP